MNNIYKKFAKGAVITELNKFNNPYKIKKKKAEDWAYIGINNFKRKTMGLCGSKAIKPINDLSNVLIELNITNNYNDSINFISKLYDTKLNYSIFTLEFKKITNKYNSEFCLIKKYPNVKEIGQFN